MEGKTEKGFLKKDYSAKEVQELLKKQITACAERIAMDNLSEYTAKKLIMETPLIDIK